MEGQERAVMRQQFVLVDRTDLDVGNEDLPHADAGMESHRMAAAIPLVEITDDARALCIGRPHCERDARNTLVFERMRPEFFPES